MNVVDTDVGERHRAWLNPLSLCSAVKAMLSSLWLASQQQRGLCGHGALCNAHTMCFDQLMCPSCCCEQAPLGRGVGGKPRGNEKQCRPGLTTPVPSCVRPQASGLPAAGAGLCQGRATSASPPQEGPEQVCSVGLGLAPGLASGGVWPGPGLR